MIKVEDIRYLHGCIDRELLSIEDQDNADAIIEELYSQLFNLIVRC